MLRKEPFLDYGRVDRSRDKYNLSFSYSWCLHLIYIKMSFGCQMYLLFLTPEIVRQMKDKLNICCKKKNTFIYISIETYLSLWLWWGNMRQNDLNCEHNTFESTYLTFSFLREREREELYTILKKGFTDFRKQPSLRVLGRVGRLGSLKDIDWDSINPIIYMTEIYPTGLRVERKKHECKNRYDFLFFVPAFTWSLRPRPGLTITSAEYVKDDNMLTRNMVRPRLGCRLECSFTRVYGYQKGYFVWAET